VFEIGGVVDARRQHRDHGPRGAGLGRAGGERTAQVLRIAAHRLHRNAGEEFREHLQHGFAVLQHVGDAGRRARVVLEHEELVFVGAHDVDADDMGVDVAGRRDADHLRQEGLVPGDQLHRDTPGAQDFLAVIDVVQEGIDGAHALFDAALQARQLPARDDARHHVEGNQAFRRFLLTVDVEGDAGAAEEPFGLRRLLLQLRRVLGGYPGLVVGVWAARRLVEAEHLVKTRFCLTHAKNLK
jgi:hypothetical protein